MLEASSITGSAKAVLEFAKEAARAHSGLSKVDLSVLTFSRGEGENGLTKAVRDFGIPIDIVSERHRFDTRIIPQLRALVAERRADVIWSNSVKSHFVVRWAGLKNSGSWVAFHHGYTTTDAKMLIYNQLDRWSLQDADQVLTCSAGFVEELERRNVRAHRIHVQRMPVRSFQPVLEKRKSELRRELGLDARTRVLLCVGRLSREKGHVDLLRAFATMHEIAVELPMRLVLVGEGPERSRIEELGRALNLTERIILAGQQNDVNPYYAIADVFVLPSLSEGSPNVLLEAMAAGVPVVATTVGGIPEIVQSGRDALLVEKHDADGLAAATVRLLRDRQLRDRLVATAREIVSRHTPEAYFESLVSVFSHACATRDARS